MDADEKLKVRVRMYRQGLGDCFLLTFRRGSAGDGKPFNILIDCGVLGNSEVDYEKMGAVAQDIKTETGNRINLLIATHRHWDHLSGFLQVPEVFDKIVIDQVWAGWTEDPEDDQAKRMWKGADTSLMAVYAALAFAEAKEAQGQQAENGAAGAAMSADEAQEEAKEDGPSDSLSGARQELRNSIRGLLSFSGEPPDKAEEKDEDASDTLSMLSSLLSSMIPPLEVGGVRKDPKKAMRHIIGRSVKSPEYLEPKRDDKTCPPITVEGLEGVRFYVLGPPRGESYLRHINLLKRDPEHTIYDLAGPAFATSFIASLGLHSFVNTKAPTSNLVDQYLPFDMRYAVTAEAAKDERSKGHPKTYDFLAEHYGFDDVEGSGSKWRRIDDDWMSVTGELALWLNSVVNNTSLALAIELVESRKVLMFVADAQIGNWQSWGELSWTIREENGEIRTVDINDLFERTVLYKVGHHGSHNATLRAEGLKRMKHSDLVALIPVNKATARAQTNRYNLDGWEMPAEKLYKALNRQLRGRVLQADEPLPVADDLHDMSDDAKQTFLQSLKSDDDLWLELEIQG